jgi:hypothetical protein
MGDSQEGLEGGGDEGVGAVLVLVPVCDLPCVVSYAELVPKGGLE